MNILEIQAIHKLRRDNDYNYEKVKDTFIPYNGEVILIDTATTGLRSKIGDGVSTYAQLRYVDEIFSENIIVRGYLFNNAFYLDANMEVIATASVNKIYINIPNSKLYMYNGERYITLTETIPAASSIEPGLVKLYEEKG